jgi:hypothetical protein
VLTSPTVSVVPPIHVTRKDGGQTPDVLAHSNAVSEMSAAYDRNSNLTMFAAEIFNALFTNLDKTVL